MLAALSGGIAGALVRTWWTHRIARKRKRIPRHWPLDPRLLANSEERNVWIWMNRVFFDHHIMLKLPVTRFTFPRVKNEGQHWYTLLSGVYCTFTVCTADGHVVGCVDVPGPAGLSRSNRQLKLTLLSQCDIAYWVMKSDNFPTLTEIRSEFLGELDPVARPPSQDEARISATSLKLQASLARQRRQRSKGALPAAVSNISPEHDQDHEYPASSGFGPLGSDWQQQNSFLGALDSRRGELR